MKRFPFVALGAVLAAAVLLASPTLEAQLQQSGGPGSTVTIATSQPNLTTPLNVSLSSLPALVAGTAIIGKIAPVTGCGTTSFSQAIAAVPTSATAITTTTTCITAAYFNNTNASAQTVTLTDNSGTPINIVGPAFSLPGLSNMVIPLGGIQASSGVKWNAGGTGVTGGVIGVQ